MTQIYEVFTKLSLVNGVSPVVAIIAKDILRLEGSVNSLNKSLGNLSTKLAIGGGLAFAGGTAVLAGMADMVKHGEKLVHVKQQLMAADVKGVELSKATAEAWKLSSKYGLDVSQVLGDIKEARMVFGSTAHAIEFMDPLEKMRVVLNSVAEGKGNAAKDAVYEMARAGELKGLQDPKDFVRYFDQMTKVISASGGKIDPHAFLKATQYGRIASQGFSEEFYTQYFPSMIQTMGASQAGNALMSLMQNGAMGKAGKQGTNAWIEMGLITHPEKLHTGIKGDLSGGWDYGATENAIGQITNPFKWAQETLGAALKKKFGENISADNPEVIAMLTRMYGNRTSAQAIAEMALQGNRMLKDAGLIKRAHGIEFADELMAHDPTAVMNRFHFSWENMLEAFTEPLVQPKLDLMNRLSDTFNRLAKWAVEHPDAVASIGEGIAKLSAAFVVGGAAALMAAIGPVGWFVAGISALGFAFGKFDENTIENITAAIEGWNKAVDELRSKSWDQIFKELGGAWDILIARMKNAILDFAGGIATGIYNLLPDWVKKYIPAPTTSMSSAFGRDRQPGQVPTPFIQPHSDNVYDSPVFKKQTGKSFAESFARMGKMNAGNDNKPPPWVGDGVFDAIIRAEGTAKKGNPYNEVLGYGRYGKPDKPLTDMTLSEAYSFGRKIWAEHAKEVGEKRASSAIGAFQIVGRTMRDYMKEAGLSWNDKFSEENQKKLAAVIARHQGLGAWEGFKFHPEEREKAQKALQSIQPRPKSDKQARNDETILQIDGETIGRVVSKHIARLHEHSRQAPYFNSRGMFHSPDTQFAVG